jgi:hypothetical protein
MSFWESELGEVTGSADDAFAKTFTSIPDGTMALAKINAFTNKEYQGNKYLEIDWLLTDGDFKGLHVFQKIKAFDHDPKVKHRALNMLILIYQMFKQRPKSSAPPMDDDLMVFNEKPAGIKIQETEPNENGRVYNWVSEVHPAQGFKCETGIKVEVTHQRQSRPESAFTRYNDNKTQDNLIDHVPF